MLFCDLSTTFLFRCYYESLLTFIKITMLHIQGKKLAWTGTHACNSRIVRSGGIYSPRAFSFFLFFTFANFFCEAPFEKNVGLTLYILMYI
jgi:hypothetical protein